MPITLKRHNRVTHEFLKKKMTLKKRRYEKFLLLHLTFQINFFSWHAAGGLPPFVFVGGAGNGSSADVGATEGRRGAAEASRPEAGQEVRHFDSSAGEDLNQARSDLRVLFVRPERDNTDEEGPTQKLKERGWALQKKSTNAGCTEGALVTPQLSQNFEASQDSAWD